MRGKNFKLLVGALIMASVLAVVWNVLLFRAWESVVENDWEMKTVLEQQDIAQTLQKIKDLEDQIAVVKQYNDTAVKQMNDIMRRMPDHTSLVAEINALSEDNMQVQVSSTCPNWAGSLEEEDASVLKAQGIKTYILSVVVQGDTTHFIEQIEKVLENYFVEYISSSVAEGSKTPGGNVDELGDDGNSGNPGKPLNTLKLQFLIYCKQ